MTIPFDEYGYAFTALVTVVMQLLCFAIAYGCRFDLITDLAGSSNFILIALLTLFLGPGGAQRARPLILTSLLILTRLELAAFLLYRVCRRASDSRFDEARDSFWKFLAFWVFQMLWAWCCSLPVIFVNSFAGDEQPDIGAADIIGWVFFAVGFGIQVLADIQKYNFRADPANRGKFCGVGVWRFSRHPNYFGEISMWWGLWLSAFTVVIFTGEPAAGWSTIVSPLWTMVILIFGSGMPMAEGSSLARFYENAEEGRRWEEYRHRTSPIVPMPNALYAVLPLIGKRIFLCEYRFLEYKPEEKAANATAGLGQADDTQGA